MLLMIIIIAEQPTWWFKDSTRCPYTFTYKMIVEAASLESVGLASSTSHAEKRWSSARFRDVRTIRDHGMELFDKAPACSPTTSVGAMRETSLSRSVEQSKEQA